MAKATGKRLNDFMRLEQIQKYLQILSQRCNLPIYQARNPVKGDAKSSQESHFLIEEFYKGKRRNTYFHPKLVLRFAQWCSAECAVEVDFWFCHLLKSECTLDFTA